MNEPAQPAPVGKPIRYLSVCSGMEAASVAWHPLGWQPVGFSEIEPFPCAILKHRFPNTPNYGSLTEHHTWPIEKGAVDLLVGGTPCQSFSVAGLRKGLADPRGNLALTFLGLADRLKPKWIIWENVPGVLSSNGGRDFGSFVGALGQLGYGWAMRILDAQHFGVPQRRRRVFVVACLGDWRAPAEVLSLREGLRGYLEAGGKKRKGVAADAGSGVEAGGLHRTVGTLCADTHPGAYSGQDAYTGRLIPSHWEGGDIHPTLNQAHNIGSPGYSNQELFSQKGAGLVPAFTIPIQDGCEMEKSQNGMGIAKEGDPAYTIDTTGAQAAGIPFRKSKRAASTTDNETWVPADVKNTLNNFDLGDTRTTHAVVEQQVYENSRRDALRIYNGSVPTLQSFMGTGGCNVPMVNHTMPGSVAPTVTSSGPPYSRTGNERVEAEALAITVNIYGGNKRKDRPEGGMYVRSEDTSKCLDAANGLNPTCSQGGTAVVGAMAVRRLTPIECERLQGFPDNWSRIPWKGKPETECPDGPRYKACGNSMAVPVMRWIGERIAAVEASPHA